MAIKKPRYVRKSDFVAAFDRPPTLWFLSNEELDGLFQSYYRQRGMDYEIDLGDGDDADIDEYIEFDVLANLAEQNQIQQPLSGLNADAKFIAGRIIAQEMKAYITRFCKQTMGVCDIIDFDQLYDPLTLTIDERAQKTQAHLERATTNTLFFSPVIIHRGAVCIPFALVKGSSGYELFAGKATTSSKRADILNLYFEIKLLKEALNARLIDAYFCLVAYEFKAKRTISFTLAQELHITKAANEGSVAAAIKEQNLPFYSEVLVKEKQLQKKIGRLKINDLIREDFENLQLAPQRRMRKNQESISEGLIIHTTEIIDKPKKTRKSVHDTQFIDHLIKLRDNFWETLQTIQQAQPETHLEIQPNPAFSSFWHKFRSLAIVRRILGFNYPIFLYSGKLVRWEDALLFVRSVNYIKQNTSLFNWISAKTNVGLINFVENLINLCKKSANISNFSSEISAASNNTFCDWRRLAIGGGCRFEKINYFIYPEAYDRLRELRRKKIYFDFETINEAIRVIDDSLPYMQIVTQCSIVVDEGDNKLSKSNNLIVDPANITKEFFKQIIDALYRENAHEYSYVVYNQSFEINRLIEMKSILNDDLYASKIDAIIANVYDLADFFAPNKHLLTIAQLYSYYSIKYVLGLVPQRLLSATDTVSYSTLAVKRGDRAQILTALRFLGALSDEEWAQVAIELQRYCENDVRAMIAVEWFVKELLANYNPPMPNLTDPDDPDFFKAITLLAFERDDELRIKGIFLLLQTVLSQPVNKQAWLLSQWQLKIAELKELAEQNASETSES